MINGTEKDVIKDLLRKFYRHGYWGVKHMREDSLTKGFPDHLKGRIKDVAEDLRRKGTLKKWPTSHGIQWCANIERLEEIERIIRDC